MYTKSFQDKAWVWSDFVPALLSLTFFNWVCDYTWQNVLFTIVFGLQVQRKRLFTITLFKQRRPRHHRTKQSSTDPVPLGRGSKQISSAPMVFYLKETGPTPCSLIRTGEVSVDHWNWAPPPPMCFITTQTPLLLKRSERAGLRSGGRHDDWRGPLGAALWVKRWRGSRNDGVDVGILISLFFFSFFLFIFLFKVSKVYFMWHRTEPPNTYRNASGSGVEGGSICCVTFLVFFILIHLIHPSSSSSSSPFN